MARHQTIRIDDKVYEQIIEFANQHGLNITDAIRNLIQLGLQKKNHDNDSQKSSESLLTKEDIGLLKMGTLAAKECLLILRENFLDSKESIDKNAFEAIAHIRREMALRFPETYTYDPQEMFDKAAEIEGNIGPDEAHKEDLELSEKQEVERA